jgi:hypothetical protein
MSGDHPRIGMIVFLVTFFLIYGGMHFYIFTKIRNAVSPGMYTRLSLIVFMVLMVLSPLLIRLLERLDFEGPARALSYIGYTWTGVAFLFFSVAIIIDAYRRIVTLGGALFSRDVTSLVPTDMHLFLVPLVCAAAISLYGFFEARAIRTERIVITTPKLDRRIGTLKIAQISDVHLGLIVREQRLGRILDAVRREEPDIVVSTGDLVDGQICRFDGILAMLNDLTPRYGKYAVTGNHEFYAGLPQALNSTVKSGFTILRGETATVPGVITLVGVDDAAAKTYEKTPPVSEREALSGAPHETFTLLLKHQPVVDKESIGMFDLQLSGHTHGGQIFPFGLITRMRYGYSTGHFQLHKGSHLYVSRGSGTWGPPIRFLAPPEVTIIELIHERGS